MSSDRVPVRRTVAVIAICGALGAGIHPGHVPMEDESSWDCVSDGNRICGPGNPQGQPAGCYDDGGVLVAPWPCHVVVNPDGSADVFGD